MQNDVLAACFMADSTRARRGKVAWPPRGRRPAGFTSEAGNYCGALRGFLVIDYSVCFRSGLLVRFGKLRRTEFEGQLFDRAVERAWRLIVIGVHSSAG